MRCYEHLYLRVTIVSNRKMNELLSNLRSARCGNRSFICHIKYDVVYFCTLVSIQLFSGQTCQISDSDQYLGLLKMFVYRLCQTAAVATTQCFSWRWVIEKLRFRLMFWLHLSCIWWQSTLTTHAQRFVSPMHLIKSHMLESDLGSVQSHTFFRGWKLHVIPNSKYYKKWLIYIYITIYLHHSYFMTDPKYLLCIHLYIALLLHTLDCK